MTEPRDPPLPTMEPITAFGMPVVPPASVGTAIKRPRSRFDAMGDVSRYEWDRTRDRWTLPGEIWDEAIDIEQFRDIVGERDIPFTPGITAAEAERRRDLFEYEKREALYETHPISQFLAAIPPTVLDPVSVGTMPIGGVNFKLAKEAAGWMPFLRQTAIGGAKAGAASIVPEYMIQQAETGMIEPGRLIGSAIGPVIAAPVLGAVGRALSRGYQGVRTRINGDAAALGHRAANSDPRVHPLDKEAAVLDAEERGLPTPYIGERTSPQPVPMQRLRETFADYDGGWRGFVRDLGAGREGAAVKARAIGIDPENNEVVGRLLAALGDHTEATSRPPLEYTAKVLDAFNLFRAGEATDAKTVRLLQDNGLVVPTSGRGTIQTEVDGRALTPAEMRDRGLGASAPSVALSAVGVRLAAALRDPSLPANRQLLDSVNETGVGAVRAALRRARGEGVSVDDDLDVLPRILSEDSIDAPTVMHHLDAAALRSQVPDAADLPPPPAPPPAARPAPDEVADAATLDAKALARELGVDVNDIDEAVGGLFDGVTVCGR